MVDWDRSTGNSGTMRIRDTGTYVEFWVSANNSTTYNHQMPWRYKINGSTSAWKEYDYKAGSGFELLGRWNITSDQTVTFYLGDTGTSGLGGPTTFSHAIDRASPPNGASACALTVLNSTTIRVTFTDGSSNGATIDARQIGYGRNSSGPEFTTASDRSTDVGALSPDTVWYFWARSHNAKGWGVWGPRTSARTWTTPYPPSAVSLSNIGQTSVHADFVGNYGGGTTVLEYQIGYGTNATTPQLYLTATSGHADINNLNPGLKYYFWARGRNSVGWGAWSVVSSATLIAGAYLKVGSTWKRAVPYVRVNGVWRVAKVWGKVSGSWRETL